MPVDRMVRPFRSAMDCTVSPCSTTYSTPRVFTATAWMPPLVFWYRVAARFAGMAAISSSPFISRGTISSAAP